MLSQLSHIFFSITNFEYLTAMTQGIMPVVISWCQLLWLFMTSFMSLLWHCNAGLMARVCLDGCLLLPWTIGCVLWGLDWGHPAVCRTPLHSSPGIQSCSQLGQDRAQGPQTKQTSSPTIQWGTCVITHMNIWPVLSIYYWNNKVENY